MYIYADTDMKLISLRKSAVVLQELFCFEQLKKEKEKTPRNKKQEHVQLCIWVFSHILVEQIFLSFFVAELKDNGSI